MGWHKSILNRCDVGFINILYPQFGSYIEGVGSTYQQSFTQHVENYCPQENPNMLTFKKMKSLEELNQEAAEINLTIRKLVLNKHCFDAGLEEKIAVVVKITTLRKQLALVQRDIRIQSADQMTG